MALYHRDIYMPEQISNMQKDFTRTYIGITHHATMKAQQRGINLDKQRSIFSCIDGKDIVEAEVQDGVLIKIVVRRPYNFDQDICFVLRYDLQTSCLVLVTVWLNSVDDDHSTLDESVYEKE